MNRPDVVTAPPFDEALIRKYDAAGPRYTSYPTAPHFHTGFGPEEYAAALGEIKPSEGAGLSLYFHLPFCRRVCYFCACNTIFTNDRNRGRGYNELLKREMDLVRTRLPAPLPVRQLHWGGGTPTFNAPDILDDLAGAIHDRFEVAPDAEISVEVDPRETTEAHLETMRRHGFNRISLGVQDFDPDVQKAVNRVQPLSMTRATIEASRALGYKSVNVDLIYGLPRQTLPGFEQTLTQLIDLAPDRVALFNFAYLPEMIRHQRILKPEQLPRPSEKLRMLRRGIERLTGAGWTFIGMDHFARPEDDLARALGAGRLHRNFQGYTIEGDQALLGFGVSAISHVGDCYAQNWKTFEEWQQSIEMGRLPVGRGIRSTDDDRLRREIIQSLMCRFEVNWREIAARHGIDPVAVFSEEFADLAAMAADGLVQPGVERLTVLPAGRLLVRNIAMVFDARLRAGAAGRYSRTV